MVTRWRGAAAVILSAVLIGGCSSGSDSAARNGRPAPDDTAAQAAEKGEGSAGGTRRERFMPVLAAAYSRVEWPKSYTMTTEQLWQKLGGDANQSALVEADAVGMVSIWNACAWSLQLIDDTKAGRPTDDAVAGLAALDNGDLRELVGPIVSEARLGGLTTVNQFVTANECAKGFPR